LSKHSGTAENDELLPSIAKAGLIKNHKFHPNDRSFQPEKAKIKENRKENNWSQNNPN
jgi:hypothetical protein